MTVLILQQNDESSLLSCLLRTSTLTIASNLDFFVNLINQSTILLLTGKPGKKWKPLLINSAGEQNELTCFERDSKTEASDSSSVNWKNQLFIFGGYNEVRQISRLTGHKLERVGSLPFDHRRGACSVMAEQFIFLCFGDDGYKRCRRSTGPLKQFSEVASSTNEHKWNYQTSCSDSKLYLS